MPVFGARVEPKDGEVILSPDGTQWWTGAGWETALLSPDKNELWTGSRWVKIRATGHAIGARTAWALSVVVCGAAGVIVALIGTRLGETVKPLVEAVSATPVVFIHFLHEALTQTRLGSRRLSTVAVGGVISAAAGSVTLPSVAQPSAPTDRFPATPSPYSPDPPDPLLPLPAAAGLPAESTRSQVSRPPGTIGQQQPRSAPTASLLLPSWLRRLVERLAAGPWWAAGLAYGAGLAVVDNLAIDVGILFGAPIVALTGAAIGRLEANRWKRVTTVATLLSACLNAAFLFEIHPLTSSEIGPSSRPFVIAAFVVFLFVGLFGIAALGRFFDRLFFQPGLSIPSAAHSGTRRDRPAVGALVIGIVAVLSSWLLWGITLGPIAAIIGFKSSRRVVASEGTIHGGGPAIAGLVLGIIAFILSVGMWLLLTFAVHPSTSAFPALSRPPTFSVPIASPPAFLTPASPLIIQTPSPASP